MSNCTRLLFAWSCCDHPLSENVALHGGLPRAQHIRQGGSTNPNNNLSASAGFQEFFNCVQRGDGSGRWWLVAEPSIECYDLSAWNQHTQLLPVCCVAMLVYVGGIPLLFGTLLFRRRKVCARSSLSPIFPFLRITRTTTPLAVMLS